MPKEKDLNEGRMGRFVDKIFYKILNGIHDKIIKSIKQDPEMKKKINDFERAKENLVDALERAGDPENYDRVDRDSGTSSKHKKGPKSKNSDNDSNNDDEDPPEFIRKMMD